MLFASKSCILIIHIALTGYKDPGHIKYKDGKEYKAIIVMYRNTSLITGRVAMESLVQSLARCITTQQAGVGFGDLGTSKISILLSALTAQLGRLTLLARFCPSGTNLQMTVDASNHRFASSSKDALLNVSSTEFGESQQGFGQTVNIQSLCYKTYREATAARPLGRTSR